MHFMSTKEDAMTTTTTRLRRLVGIAAAVAAFAVPTAASAAPPPGNDMFASARAITGESGRSASRTVAASKEPGEPNHAGNAGGRSVWFAWTAPVDGQYRIETIGTLDSLLAVYTGDTVDALTLVAENDDRAPGSDETSVVSFRATGGILYRIAVDAFGGKGDWFDLLWEPAPANDNFADAMPLNGRFGDVDGTLAGATMEEFEFVYYFPTIWFRWTAPETGPFSFSTRQTDYGKYLAVYTGGAYTLAQIVANEDDELLCCGSRLLLNAVAGTTYSIQVTSIWSESALALRWRPVLLGTSGPDVITGSADPEEIQGLAGSDVIHGGGGDDQIFPGAGRDEAYGDEGNDVVADLQGLDRLFGGPGDDFLSSYDYRRGDYLGGGGGVDRCVGDRGDRRKACP
jgi:Ca2+-binding RTX toxin-like protein